MLNIGNRWLLPLWGGPNCWVFVARGLSQGYLQSEMEENPAARKFVLWGFFRRRECLLPTWRFVLLAVGLTALSVTLVVRSIHPFLATHEPLKQGALVVEGWLSDPALKHAIYYFQNDGYDRMFATGGPVDVGSQLMAFSSYADLCAASLTALGMDTNKLQAVPAPAVQQDRTYTSALALKRWLELHGQRVTHITVASEAAHARRSRLLFQKAFGPGVRVGTMAIPTTHYDMHRWWASSPGVRAVIGEALAYVYARFLFWPAEPQPMLPVKKELQPQ